ncbi:Acyl-CoA synthetase (AMP-forming)/AMP-acid ligase II [Amycolatopsis pretoriensis]|uniref:Acyl-CoA synthetase (AMP-forming)/AMP-acid ligase II n=1 Tax=Amycolatopsis pretoriensis TaxID=218821 RepID=A0A1H5QJL7_9PSEU|nr:AMP-binding protein [Amycolatopsis pretoriensis]SEF26239.1 Acyl-CoA synthetase (AMP-forming)/AMP-acid ligase II [Amycolatopsis pretoriensis]
MLTSSERVFGGRVAEAGATTLSTLLARRAGVAGGEPALTWLATTLTWASLDRRVTAVAAALRQVTEPGQRAAILIARPVDHVVAFLGAIRAGLVAIPLDTGNRAAVTDAEPSIVLATADSVTATRRFLSTLDTCGHRVLAVDIVEKAKEFTEDPVAGEDVAYLQYPAGVMVTHANVVANARQAAAELPGRTIVSWRPPSDPLGLLLAVAVPITTGRPVVLVDRRPPLHLPLDAGVLASAADPDLVRFREAFAADALRVCHVVAEATAVVAVEGAPAGQRIAIVDPAGRRRPAGEAGEIWVSGPNVGRGYWNRPAESARVFCAFLADDDEPRWWLRTGDLGVLDGSATLSVLGRVVAGHDSRELEATAKGAHPAVREAAATGGERAVVVVGLRPRVVPPRGEVERAVRAALAAEHGLTPRRVVVLPAGADLGGAR